MNKKIIVVIFLLCLLFLRACTFLKTEDQNPESIVVVPIVVKNQDQEINATQIDLKFSKNLVFEKIEKNKTFFEHVLEEKVDEETKWLRLSGGLKCPGITAGDLELVKVYFRYVGSGKISLELMPSSLVLLNNGLASNVAGKFGIASGFGKETTTKTQGSGKTNKVEIGFGEIIWQK